ncbi:AMP-binding protein [uncultured Corynebacterium sp.]|uniref:AMP-binding protein n=1 Tax=uncultured Corynebacterium sp. TaxID=159447 RepID=UPI0026015866|nr:AMP-binding protein [uncultured Corynebacterium sp.]
MSHITRGDRVALLTRNSIESMEILPAVATLGAISVPVNYRPAPRESEFILADSEMRRAGKESELETTVTRGSPERVNRDVRENDGCMIMYTSGTTGHPPSPERTSRPGCGATSRGFKIPEVLKRQLREQWTGSVSAVDR